MDHMFTHLHMTKQGPGIPTLVATWGTNKEAFSGLQGAGLAEGERGIQTTPQKLIF